MTCILSERKSLIDECIFNSEHQTILITVNTVGAMGAGIALTCKQKHPRVYKKYKAACDMKILTPNSLTTVQIGEGKQVLLFPTKIHWRNGSPVELILDNLDKLGNIYRELNIESLATPLMGMQNGWLLPKEREIVFAKMKTTFDLMDIDCEIYMHLDIP